MRVDQAKEQFAGGAVPHRMTRNEVGRRERRKLGRCLQDVVVGSIGGPFDVEEVNAIGRAAEGIGELTRQTSDRVQNRRRCLRQTLLRRDMHLACPAEGGLDFRCRCAGVDSEETERLS
ncbi:hypothetical protein [Bradyrhizobium sp. CCBAU 051011]|uniref:hypothetical protein n=1 Tax=Bradyrhizobium sp. CCBAU 051011 TaxID=858422 RepID=UPI00137ABA70|nr:hypothetical protein [Bradyrhizobium sp. CCBAU 051011]